MTDVDVLSRFDQSDRKGSSRESRYSPPTRRPAQSCPITRRVIDSRGDSRVPDVVNGSLRFIGRTETRDGFAT